MNFHKIKESRHKNKNKEERLNDDDSAFYSKRALLGRRVVGFFAVTCPFNICERQRCIKRSADAHISWQLHNFEFFCCGVWGMGVNVADGEIAE